MQPQLELIAWNFTELMLGIGTGCTRGGGAVTITGGI